MASGKDFAPFDGSGIFSARQKYQPGQHSTPHRFFHLPSITRIQLLQSARVLATFHNGYRTSRP
jgi:hypothetical protein